MSSRNVRPAGPSRRQGGLVPGPEPAGLGPGDPLVRALAVCIRQAHARRAGRRTLD
jgi:hypothetical protein